MLADGKNVISAVLGRGHYSGFCGYSGAMIYGKESSFIAMLNIVYTDGTSEVIKTDSSWEFTDKAPISDCDYFDGESYDARLEYNSLRTINAGLNAVSNNNLKACPDKRHTIRY